MPTTFITGSFSFANLFPKDPKRPFFPPILFSNTRASKNAANLIQQRCYTINDQKKAML